MIVVPLCDPLTVEELPRQGRAGHKIRGVPLNQLLHDLVVKSALQGFFLPQRVSVAPVVGMDKAVLHSCKTGRQQHHTAMKQLMGMDNVVFPVLHHSVDCLAVFQEVRSVGGGNVDAFSAKCKDFVLIKRMIRGRREVDLEFPLIRRPQQVHQLILDAAHIHCAGENQNADLSIHADQSPSIY